MFNFRAGRLQMSTLRRRINQRDWVAAGQELCRWVCGRRKVLPGLVARREAEITTGIRLSAKTNAAKTAPQLSDKSHQTAPNHAKSYLFVFTRGIIHAIISTLPLFRLLMETHAMSDRWLSVEEIAEYLGVSKDTVYAWISKRNMPAHRIGRLWKFKSEEVDEWVRSGGAAENEGRGKE